MGSTASSKDKLPLWQPLTIRNFLLLFIGESVSLLGDQFYLVALPWLAIQLTQSPISLGGVLMTAAIPRAVLMLLGGVLSDRLSPRLIMLVSNAVRAVLTAVLAVLVFYNAVQLWLLYLFALIFGIVDGFFIPAAKSMIPTLVTKELLAVSNTISQGSTQLIMLVGPALGGLLIATVSIETAFAIDAASFIFSVVTLMWIDSSKQSLVTTQQQTRASVRTSTLVSSSASLMTSIREGLNYAWHNPALRAVLLVLTMLNFFFVGPLEVGIVSLAESRFSGGAIALGTMKSAWGGGALLGTVMTGVIRPLPRIGVLMLSLASIQGVGLFVLGFLPNVVLASITIAILGCCSGFFTVLGITWIQKQTPPEMLGRVMSLGMFSAFGIAPFSYALSGLLADFNLIFLFSCAGGTMISIIALLAVNPFVRSIE